MAEAGCWAASLENHSNCTASRACALLQADEDAKADAETLLQLASVEGQPNARPLVPVLLQANTGAEVANAKAEADTLRKAAYADAERVAETFQTDINAELAKAARWAEGIQGPSSALPLVPVLLQEDAEAKAAEAARFAAVLDQGARAAKAEAARWAEAIQAEKDAEIAAAEADTARAHVRAWMYGRGRCRAGAGGREGQGRMALLGLIRVCVAGVLSL